MKKNNKYWILNWVLFFGVLLIVMILSGTAIYFVLKTAEPPPLAGVDKYFGASRTAKKKKVLGEQIILNDGQVIRLGTEAEFVAPAYGSNRGQCRYFGLISNIRSETGHVLLRASNAVVELNYRYIVNLDATERVCGTARTELSDTLVGVVFLNRSGIEQLHFIRDLDNPNEGRQQLKIDQMVDYTNLKIHDIATDKASLPDDIVYFYENSEVIAA